MSNELNNREVAIQLSGVKKMYKLGQIGGGTLQADLQSWWARVRGKEDPNSIVGSNQRLIGKTFMALNGIDLTIYKGEAVGIIGGNGAGKSTMLKLLSRVTAPTEGEIDIYGRIASMLEVGTGFNGEMTGRENVYMNGAILGMTKAEIDAKMEDIIEFSEVREFIDTPVKRYSSGMYVKLAFSVAAHLDSEIMIMDEVLAVGDMAFQKKCLNKMRDAATKQGRTVLYVSHNMNTIRQLCDRCIVLDTGKIVFSGDVEAAIEVYLGKKHTFQREVEIEDCVRDLSCPNPPVRITKITSDCLDGILDFGEKIAFIFDLESYLDVTKELYVRLVLRTQDEKNLMMSPCNQPIKIDAKQKMRKKYIFDISNVVPGDYSVSFILMEIGEMGVMTNVDILRDIYSFSIRAVQGFNHNIPWETKWWGNIMNGYLEG